MVDGTNIQAMGMPQFIEERITWFYMPMFVAMQAYNHIKGLIYLAGREVIFNSFLLVQILSHYVFLYFSFTIIFLLDVVFN